MTKQSEMELGGPGTSVAKAQGSQVPAETPSLESMMVMAVQQGPEGVEALERLVALKERMEDRDARRKFLDALHEFQQDMEELPKNRSASIVTKSGSRYGYRYTSLDAITKAIREPLKQHGFSYAWDTEASAKAGELVVVFVLRHVDGHEERSRFPVPTETPAAMSGAQKNGAALTYGRRQSLIAGLGLTSTDEDNDAPEMEMEGDPLDPEQVKEINDLILSTGADKDGFLAFLKVERVNDIGQDRFEEAKSLLHKSARQKAAK